MTQTRQYIDYLLGRIDYNAAVLKLIDAGKFKMGLPHHARHSERLDVDLALFLQLNLREIEAVSFDPANPDDTKFLPYGSLASSL